VVQNPPDSIIDGEEVHVVAPQNDRPTGKGGASAERGK
jgi:hypothetical protein